MQQAYNRRNFIRTTALAGAALGLGSYSLPLSGRSRPAAGTRIGIIGLDTSHSVAMTKTLNAENADAALGGYKVVAAYPQGSLDIASSVKRIPEYTEALKKMGVEIVDSIPELLKKVDVVMLETNDGRRHLEQALPVLKAGKRLFIDKPIAASLADTIVIFEEAKKYNVPVFSSSSLRFMSSAQAVVNGKVGKVVGADAYSPCALEKTHPDFFWYGIHGVEILYTVMGTGCKEVVRVHTDSTDIAIGTWEDGRIGTFRGTRTGQHTYGGTAYGEKGDAVLGPFEGYEPLLLQIIKFFQTGTVPVKPEDTLEICAFMEAADESKRHHGAPASMEKIWERARKEAARKSRNS
ncbi:Gfo/Idh/MocA family protein [Compostibacter hankyongensis]|uniref:Gfo/Idh/MocA family oxidoreductase n=1 Tax=Compostibacter hankyongensis TaxID=1007089 RepID=A0ABP8G9T9_9BACT